MSPKQIWYVGAEAHLGYFHGVLRAVARQGIGASGFPEECPQGILQRWPSIKPRFYLPVEVTPKSHPLSFRSLSHLPTNLLPLLKVIMPRGQKCKARAREKRRQARQQAQNLVGAEATTSANEDSNYQVEQRSRSSQAPSTVESFYRGRLKEKVILLVYYLLYKYQNKEPITKGEMVRNIIQTYRNHFLEILKRASDHMEMVFGLDMKELDPYRHVYILVNKLEPCCGTVLNDDGGVPKTGLLMTILGVIYMNHNRATEEQVWKILNVMGLYWGRRHFLFGEPKKLITEDLVKENYLVYRQVPHSHPPHHEFLWGPRAHVETTKMKVLEFLAKVHDTDPTTFPFLYKEALKDEEERAQARAAARAHKAAMASERSRAKEHSRAKEGASTTPNKV